VLTAVQVLIEVARERDERLGEVAKVWLAEVAQGGPPPSKVS